MESEAVVTCAVPCLLLLALAGCPGKGPPDPTYTPAGPKPCEKMADHVVELMVQPKDRVTGKRVDVHETSDKIARLLIDACTKDKWTQDAQRCWLALTSANDLEKCAPLMTVEQRDSLAKAIDTAFPRDPEPAKPDAGSGSESP